MAPLPNPRHERFAQELAKGKTNSEAYKHAGYSADGNAAEAAASRLLSNANVRARLSELQERSAARTEVTVDGLINEARSILQLATRDGQYSAAVAALREMGILSGKRVERAERGAPGEFADLNSMTADELRAFVASQLAESGVLSAQDSDFDGEGETIPSGRPH